MANRREEAVKTEKIPCRRIGRKLNINETFTMGSIHRGLVRGEGLELTYSQVSKTG